MEVRGWRIELSMNVESPLAASRSTSRRSDDLTADMTATLPNLDYAPMPANATSLRWRRRVRRFIPVLALALVAWQFGPWLYQVARFRYLQHQCGNYTRPAG